MTIDQPTTLSTPARRFGTRARPTIARVALYLGALAVLATGIAHVQQFYADDYSSVPTIGTLFYLNFVSAVVIAAGLVAPLGRIAGRYAGTIRDAFAVAGIGLGVGVSKYGGLVHNPSNASTALLLTITTSFLDTSCT